MFLVIITVICFVVMFHLWKNEKKRVAVVVLGDIGRSPRMQYHSLSLSEKWDVDLIGFGGSTAHAEVINNSSIHIHEMIQFPSFLNILPRLLVYISKVLWQAAILFITLLWQSRPSTILLQNPPSIPSIAVCWFVAKLRGSKLVIDWHNYGYTILALSLGKNHSLVKFSKWYEHFFGRLADYNICVTKAMKEDLAENWKISAVTMYDRPPALFHKADLVTQHTLCTALAQEYQVFQPRSAAVNRTVFTKKEAGRVQLLTDRPALLISSTSWTEDEDFSLLLNALDKYDEARCSGSRLPDIVCVITGKGPLKAFYQKIIAKKQWKHIQLCTPWLKAEDYPRILGFADIGVCLHTSSSGLDLPMKVVDMFGCGLPVCAVDFKCLGELVKHGENGLIFSNEEQLADQLQELLMGFPDKCRELSEFRANLESFQSLRWTELWQQCVEPLFPQE